MTRYVLPKAVAGERLDRAVAMLQEVTRRDAAALVDDGHVEVNGAIIRQRSARLAEGDVLEVDAEPVEAWTFRPDPSVEIVVRYEDDTVIVVDKPPGLVVHPGAGHHTGTLVQGLVARYPDVASVGEPARPGIVHRLDAGTSGLLVVARTAGAYESLVRQLRERTVRRDYDALVWGPVADDDGLIDAPIARSTKDPTRMSVRADGREARTRYRCVDRWTQPEVSRLSCRLETGRTHQIRVHLAAIAHPVVGDGRYGNGRVGEGWSLDRPFLHASHLRFVHPLTDEPCAFESRLPGDLVAVLDALGAPTPRA